MRVLLWFLAVYGLTTIVVSGTIFAPLRTSLRVPRLARDLLSCPLCFGTWAGFGLSFVPGLSLAVAAGAPQPFAHVLDAFAAGGFCWVMQSVVMRLDRT
jgi:hypothetical protein